MKNTPFPHPFRRISVALLLAGTAIGACAQTTPSERTNPAAGKPGVAQESSAASDATGHLNRAIAVIHQMERNRDLAALMARSKGVFVVPDSVRVAVGVGARGGAGVLLVRRANGWGSPAFYNMAGVTLGAQLGAEGGGLAFILNDQKALKGFTQKNKFSLNADAGLTFVDWSKKGEGSLGWGDITVWSDTEGLFGGATVALTDIIFDGAETAAYYRQPVTALDVLSGKVANPRAPELAQALADPATGAGAQGVGGSSDSKTRSGDSNLQPTRR